MDQSRADDFATGNLSWSFVYTHAVFVWSPRFPKRKAEEIRQKYVDAGGSVANDLVPKETNRIVSDCWDAVISKWSWETINSYIKKEKLFVLHHDWILETLRVPRVGYTITEDYSLIVTEFCSFRYKEKFAATPFFSCMNVIFLPDEMNPGQYKVLRDKLREHRARECYDLQASPTHIIANSWKAVMDHWDWREVDVSCRKRGLRVVSFEWLIDSLKSGKRLPDEDYDLWECLLNTIEIERMVVECHGHGFKWHADTANLRRPLSVLKPPSPPKHPSKRKRKA